MVVGLEDIIIVQWKKFEKLELEVEVGMILMNLFYDECLLEDDIGVFYEMIGDQFKQCFMGFDVWIIFFSIDGFKWLGLKFIQKIFLFNGVLECWFVKYELYVGI